MDFYIDVQEQLYTFEKTQKRAELENNGTFYSTGLKTNNKLLSPTCKPLGPLTPPPFKKIWRKQNYNGVYKNELQIQWPNVKPSSISQPKKAYKPLSQLYQLTVPTFISSSLFGLCSAPFNVCSNNPQFFSHQQSARSRNNFLSNVVCPIIMLIYSTKFHIKGR